MKIEFNRTLNREVTFSITDIPSSVFLLMYKGLSKLSLSRKWAEDTRKKAFGTSIEMEQAYNQAFETIR